MPEDREDPERRNPNEEDVVGRADERDEHDDDDADTEEFEDIEEDVDEDLDS